jgi:MFS family permease
MGALVGALLTRSLAPNSLDSWGWRAPFLFGLIIGPVGLYIRRHVEETEAFLEARAAPEEKHDLSATLATHFKEVMVCMGVVTAGTISFYVILLYMPTFARTQLHLPLDVAFIAQAIGLVCLTLLVPMFGALSDRVGRKPIIIGGLVLYLGLAYPLFSWVHESPSFGRLIIMQVVLCSLLGALMGPFSTAMAEQFPARVRSTGLAIAYNVAVMGFGGFAQFFVTWLIEATGSPIAPVFYVMFGGAVGLVGAFFLVDRTREDRLRATKTVPVTLHETGG